MTGALVAYRWELRKLVSQKRTYIGIGAAALLPVVFVTVHEDPEFMEAAREAGAAGYVVKSTMETELKPALEQALKGQRFVLPAS